LPWRNDAEDAFAVGVEAPLAFAVLGKGIQHAANFGRATRKTGALLYHDGKYAACFSLISFFTAVFFSPVHCLKKAV
jgi:hypothetical protein